MFSRSIRMVYTRGAPLLARLATACGAAAPTAKSAHPQQRSALLSTVSPAAPVVVELFQSQGCSSCPPANEHNAIADRADVLALSFGVTYWDQLGWKDSFARPEYTARHWDYARHAGRPNVATPQVIVNGGKAIVGSNAAQLEREIASAGSPKGGLAIRINGNAARLSEGTGGAARVWLVHYDPKTREVSIRAGENGGRTLPHRNVVRELVLLGEWSGRAASFELSPAREAGLATAILVQRGAGGPIIAARRV